MRRKTLLAIGLILLVLCGVMTVITGRTLTVSFEFAVNAPETAPAVQMSREGVVEITDQQYDGRTLRVTLRSCGRADQTLLTVKDDNGFASGKSIYTHMLGIITEEGAFGYYTGCRVLPVCLAAYLLLLLASFIIRLRGDMRRTPYRYANAVRFGIAVMLGFAVVQTILYIPTYRGLVHTFRNMLELMNRFTMFTLPLFFVVSILVTLESVRLIRREGRSWRNLLAVFLGVLLCVGALTPIAVGEWSQRTTLIDVHNTSAPTLYIVLMIENGIGAIVAYLECLLLGTIFVSLRAARAVPDFDRGYILILGCQTRSDGTLTPLLRGRADRAIEFDRLQREHGGPAVTFVPSGGQGDDEPVAEGDAIAAYLTQQGIPQERILVENKSATTAENIRFSMELIRAEAKDPKVAFSTTNYHVFRAGNIALSQGVRAQGIGAKTKRYFWINAFVREFIATLSSYAKLHLAISAALLVITAGMVALSYYSNVF